MADQKEYQGQVIRRQRRPRGKGADKQEAPEAAPDSTLSSMLDDASTPPPPHEEEQGEQEEQPPPPDMKAIRKAAQQAELIESNLDESLTDKRASRRQNPTVREIEDDGADKRLTTLEDLMARYPIGDGQYYIHVVRKQPAATQGFRVAGRQRDITDQLNYAQFIEEYGGGQYTLQTYGPPRRSGTVNPITGKPNPVKQGQEVILTVPWDQSGGGGYPPNPSAVYVEPSMLEEPMPVRHQTTDRPSRGRRWESALDIPSRRSMSTPADASIFKHAVDAEERAEQREEEVRRRDEERRYRTEREQEGVYGAMLGTVQQIAQQSLIASNRREEETRREALEREARERSEAAEREERIRSEAAEREERVRQDLLRASERNDGGVEAALKLVNALKPSDAAQQAGIDAARAELVRIQDVHARELERIEQARASEREGWQRRVDELTRRVDEVRKDIEDRADRRVAEEERRSMRLVEEAKKDAERERTALDQRYQQTIDNERRQHDRDLESRTVTNSAVLSAEKAALSAEIQQLKNQLEIERREAERWRDEAKKAGNLVERMEEFSSIAERMGFQRGGEESPTWQGMLMQGLSSVAPQLPNLLKSAGETAVALRQGPNAAAHAAHREQQMRAIQSPPPASHVLSFASDDNYPEPMSLPSFDAPQAMMPPPVHSPFVVPETNQEPPPQQQQQMPPPSMAPPEPPAASQPPPQVAPQQQAGVASEEMSEIPDAAILQFVPMVNAAYSDGTSPAEVAKGMVDQIGPAMLGPIARSLSPYRIAAVLKAHGQDGHALVSRAGQDWLRQLQTEIEVLTE